MSKKEKTIIEMESGEKITLVAFFIIIAVVGIVFAGLLGIVYLMTVSPENPTSIIDFSGLGEGMR